MVVKNIRKMMLGITHIFAFPKSATAPYIVHNWIAYCHTLDSYRAS